MIHHHKNKVYAVIAVVVIVLGGWMLFKNNPSGSTVEETEMVAGQRITVVGEITCLPYHINVAGQGCVKGIRSIDGKIFALNSPKGLENKLGDGTKVNAMGTYEPANTSFDESSVFEYDAVLVLEKLDTR